MQWDLLSPLEQRHWEQKHQDQESKRNCVAVPEQPLLLSAARSLLTWRLSSACGELSVLQAGSPGSAWLRVHRWGWAKESPANVPVLVLPLSDSHKWPCSAHCLLKHGQFLLCPSRPCPGRLVVMSHQGPTSVWGWNVWGFQVLSCQRMQGEGLGRRAVLWGWFSKGRWSLLHWALH